MVQLITGPVYEYIEFDNATTMSSTTTYTTSTTDTTHGDADGETALDRHADDDSLNRMDMDQSHHHRSAARGHNFTQRAIYELVYTAKNPWVAGIGFAAIRDLASFLRNATADTSGTANPLAGDVKRMVSFGSSQPARTMNDFIWLGFNEDLERQASIRRRVQLGGRRRRRGHQLPLRAIGHDRTQSSAAFVSRKVFSRSPMPPSPIR